MNFNSCFSISSRAAEAGPHELLKRDLNSDKCGFKLGFWKIPSCAFVCVWECFGGELFQIFQCIGDRVPGGCIGNCIPIGGTLSSPGHRARLARRHGQEWRQLKQNSSLTRAVWSQYYTRSILQRQCSHNLTGPLSNRQASVIPHASNSTRTMQVILLGLCKQF